MYIEYRKCSFLSPNCSELHLPLPDMFSYTTELLTMSRSQNSKNHLVPHTTHTLNFLYHPLAPRQSLLTPQLLLNISSLKLSLFISWVPFTKIKPRISQSLSLAPNILFPINFSIHSPLQKNYIP